MKRNQNAVVSVWDLFLSDREKFEQGAPWNELALTEEQLATMFLSSDKGISHAVCKHPKLTADMVARKVTGQRSNDDRLLYEITSNRRFYPENDALLCYIARHSSYSVWDLLTIYCTNGVLDEQQVDIVWRYANIERRNSIICEDSAFLKPWMLMEAYVEFAYASPSFLRDYYASETEFNNEFYVYAKTLLGDIEKVTQMPKDWVRELLLPFKRSVEDISSREFKN